MKWSDLVFPHLLPTAPLAQLEHGVLGAGELRGERGADGNPPAHKMLVVLRFVAPAGMGHQQFQQFGRPMREASSNLASSCSPGL